MSDKQVDSNLKVLFETKRLIIEAKNPCYGRWHKTDNGYCLEGALGKALGLDFGWEGDSWFSLKNHCCYKIMLEAAMDIFPDYNDGYALWNYNDYAKNKNVLIGICDRAITLAMEKAK